MMDADSGLGTPRRSNTIPRAWASSSILPLPFPLSGVIPLLGVLGELRALGVDAALRFLLRDVGLGDLGSRCLTDILVKLIFLQVQFHGRACHCIFLTS